MKEITAEQRSEEWFEKRRNGITATDIVAIMREHPFKTPVDVYNDKVYPRVGDDPLLSEPAVKWGMENEDNAFEDIVRLWPLNKPYKAGLVQSESNSLFLASPDGITKDGVVVEIKCPFDRELPNAPSRSHVLQVQWQLMVTESKMGYVVYWSPTGIQFFGVPADGELQKRMKDTALHFWEENILKKVPPQIDVEKTIIEKDDENYREWERLGTALYDITERIKSLEEEKKKLRQEILDLADEKAVKAPNVSVYYQWRPNINWKKACDDAGIAPYVGEPTRSVVVKPRK